MNYDFPVLSDIDFEQMVNKLLNGKTRICILRRGNPHENKNIVGAYDGRKIDNERF